MPASGRMTRIASGCLTEARGQWRAARGAMLAAKKTLKLTFVKWSFITALESANNEDTRTRDVSVMGVLYDL